MVHERGICKGEDTVNGVGISGDQLSVLEIA